MDFAEQLRLLEAAKGDHALLTLATVDISHWTLKPTERTKVRDALLAAAVPHWCDSEFLAAMLGNTQAESEELFSSLQTLNAVEPFPARGEVAVCVQSDARQALRKYLRETDRERWKQISARARAHVSKSDEPHARIEALYHLFSTDQNAAAIECEGLYCECIEVGRAKPALQHALALVLDELLEPKFTWLHGAARIEAMLLCKGVQCTREGSSELEAEIRQLLSGAETIAHESGIARASCLIGEILYSKGHLENAMGMFQTYLSIYERLIAVAPNSVRRRICVEHAASRIRDCEATFFSFKESQVYSKLIALFESFRLKELQIKNITPSASEQNALVGRGKRDRKEYDVFLCHNGEDKPAVKVIAAELIRLGISPWLDEWDLPPGMPWQECVEEQIKTISSVAVFVGKTGMGPWQNLEIRAVLSQFVKRKCAVIPVKLGSASSEPALPPFLSEMTWVDFSNGSSDPVAKFIWGITRSRPASLP